MYLLHQIPRPSGKAVLVPMAKSHIRRLPKPSKGLPQLAKLLGARIEVRIGQILLIVAEPRSQEPKSSGEHKRVVV